MPPLVTVLDTQSEDSSDVDVPVTPPVEKKQPKGSKKSPKK